MKILKIALISFLISGLCLSVLAVQQAGATKEKAVRHLLKQAPELKPETTRAVLTVLECAQQQAVDHNSLLAIIDYSLPSNKKRLWVFDLQKEKLLFHTYVSHGFKSGVTVPIYFSNKVNGKTSSVGVYHTEKAYYGRYGAALKLKGLDKTFNDNAYQRFVVMHGSWYVNESFIKKYGRAGRSWGCPTLPLYLSKAITHKIKNKALLVVYYPENRWLKKSEFLNCQSAFSSSVQETVPVVEVDSAAGVREDVIYVDANKNEKHEKNEAVVVVKADDYRKIFKKNPPLERMLRRQIGGTEYIALSNNEFKKMTLLQHKKSTYFVIPEVKLKRGYYATEMKFVNFGKIKEIISKEKEHIVQFEKKVSAELKTTEDFIRWLGL